MKRWLLAVMLLVAGCAGKRVALAPVSDQPCASEESFLQPFEVEGENGEHVLVVYCIHKDFTGHIVVPPPEILQHFNEARGGVEL